MFARALLLLTLAGEPATVQPIAAVQAEADPTTVDLVVLPGVEMPAAIRPRLDELAAAFRRATGRGLVITDGTRRPERQAELMLRNLERGDDIVRNYANKSAARAVAEAYARAREAGRAELLAALAAVIRAQVAAGDYVSKHLREGAVDIRCTDLSPAQRATLKKLARARGIAVVDESRTATPHFHLNFV